MVRSVDEGFEEFLRRLTPTKYQRLAGAKHRASVKSALEASLKVNRFFETGSFDHGTGVRGFSDIDVMVSLVDQPALSYSALTRVRDVLKARFPYTPVYIRRPAVVIGFGGGYETWEVIPGFLTSRGAKDVLLYEIPGAASESGWLESAPDEHLRYVNSCNKLPRNGKAKALARLIKAWKYYCNVPVSSFYIEMRCAQHVATQSSYIHIWDVWQVLNYMNNIQLAAMNDPSGVTGRFFACSSDAKAREALSKLSTATRQATTALAAHRAGNDQQAFIYLDLLFGGHFPSRYA